MILSVVIPTMNKCQLLMLTLEALQEQSLGVAGEWEVVVVNDGSSDGTEEYLNSVSQGPDSRLVVVSPGVNVGRAKARNLGARRARGKFILFLDDDIVAPPGLLSAHLQILMSEENIGTIGYAVTAARLVDAPHFYYMDSRGAARLPLGPAPARYFVTQNAAVPRKAFLTIGGFDEEFSAYGFEDMEVAFRLEDKTGLQFRALPKPVPTHVHHHTLEEYLAKKVECGRYSLPHLARLHPARIAEMQLHHVVDIDGPVRLGLLTRLIRGIVAGGLGRQLPRLLAAWPTSGRSRPRFESFYYRLMNVAVLCAFRLGVTESSTKG